MVRAEVDFWGESVLEGGERSVEVRVFGGEDGSMVSECVCGPVAWIKVHVNPSHLLKTPRLPPREGEQTVRV